MRARTVLNPFLATAPTLQLVPGVTLPEAGAPSGWGLALLHCLGICHAVSIHRGTRTATIAHRTTSTLPPAYRHAAHTRALFITPYFSLLCYFLPTPVSAHLEKQQPGEQQRGRHGPSRSPAHLLRLVGRPFNAPLPAMLPYAHNLKSTLGRLGTRKTVLLHHQAQGRRCAAPDWPRSAR